MLNSSLFVLGEEAIAERGTYKREHGNNQLKERGEKERGRLTVFCYQLFKALGALNGCASDTIV